MIVKHDTRRKEREGNTEGTSYFVSPPPGGSPFFARAEAALRRRFWPRLFSSAGAMAAAGSSSWFPQRCDAGSANFARAEAVLLRRFWPRLFSSAGVVAAAGGASAEPEAEVISVEAA